MRQEDSEFQGQPEIPSLQEEKEEREKRDLEGRKKIGGLLQLRRFEPDLYDI